jgi:hypothetical protein
MEKSEIDRFPSFTANSTAEIIHQKSVLSNCNGGKRGSLFLVLAEKEKKLFLRIKYVSTKQRGGMIMRGESTFLRVQKACDK